MNIFRTFIVCFQLDIFIWVNNFQNILARTKQYDIGLQPPHSKVWLK